MKKKLIICAVLIAIFIGANSSILPVLALENSQITEFRYDPNYDAVKSDNLQTFRRGERMSRQYLGYVVKPNDTIKFSSNAKVNVAIEFIDENLNRKSVTVAPGEVGTFTNQETNDLVMVARTPVYQEGYDSGEKFQIEVENASSFQRIPYYQAKSMQELPSIEEGYKIEFLNDNKEVYSTATINDYTLNYVVNAGVGSEGLDFAFHVKGMLYGDVEKLTPQTASKTIELKEGVLIEIYQSDFANHVLYKDLAGNKLDFKHDRDASSVRSMLRYQFDDGYNLFNGFKAPLEDESGNVIGNLELTTNKLNVKFDKPQSGYYVKVKNASGAVVKEANASNQEINNFELENGYEIEVSVGMVKHLQEKGSYLDQLHDNTQIYSRYQFNRGQFSIKNVSKYYNTTDENESVFAEQIKNDDIAFYLDFVGLDTLGHKIYGSRFADPKKNMNYHSLQDYSYFLENYFELINQTSGLGIYTDDVYSPEYFMSADEDSKGYLYYLGSNHIASGTGYQIRYFQTHWGLMHEIGHGYQPMQSEMYDGEVSVNFSPYTASVQYATMDNQPKQVLPSEYEKLIDEVVEQGVTYETSKNQLYFFTNIINRFGSETFAKTFGSYVDKAIHKKAEYDKENFYSVTMSEAVNLNLYPYFEAFGIETTYAKKREFMQMDYATSLRLAVGDDLAEAKYQELGLPYPEAIATKTEIDTLGLKTDLKVSFDEKLIGSKAYIYGSGYELIHEAEITSSEMTFNLPIGVYNITTDYIKDGYVSGEDIAFITTRTPSTNIANVGIKEGTYQLRYDSYGVWSRLASISVTGNKATLDSTNARTGYSSNKLYTEINVLRDGEKILSYQMYSGQNSVVRNETIELKKGDQIQIFHENPNQKRSKVLVSTTDFEDWFDTKYSYENRLDFIFNGEYLVPASADDQKMFETLYTEVENKKADLLPKYDSPGYYQAIKALSVNEINQVVTTDDKLNGSQVYVYDENNNLMLEKTVSEGKVEFKLPMGKYRFASEYVKKDGYVKDIEKVVTLTTNQPIHLAVTDQVPTDIDFDLVANTKVAQVSYSNRELKYKSERIRSISCAYDYCYDFNEGFTDLIVQRNEKPIYSTRVYATSAGSDWTDFELLEGDKVIFDFVRDGSAARTIPNQGLIASAKITNQKLSEYSNSDTGKITFTVVKGQLVPENADLSAYNESVIEKFNEDDAIKVANYDKDGYHNDIKYFRNELNDRNFEPPHFENAEDLDFKITQGEEITFGQDIIAKDNNGKQIEYKIYVTYENGDQVEYSAFSELENEIVGVHQIELYAIDDEGKETRKTGTFTVEKQTNKPTISGIEDIAQIVRSKYIIGSEVEAKDYFGNQLAIKYEVEYEDGTIVEYQMGDEIELKTVGKHRIKYTTTDKYGNETIEYANLAVLVPSEKPSIIGASDITIFIDEEYEFNNVTAKDYFGTDLVVEIYFTDSSGNEIQYQLGDKLIINELGTYKLKYKATDEYGLVSEKQVDIKVISADQKPIITGVENISGKEGEKITLGEGIEAKTNDGKTLSFKVILELEDGTITEYKPGKRIKLQAGNHKIHYVFTLENGDTYTEVVTLSVSGKNEESNNENSNSENSNSENSNNDNSSSNNESDVSADINTPVGLGKTGMQTIVFSLILVLVMVIGLRYYIKAKK